MREMLAEDERNSNGLDDMKKRTLEEILTPTNTPSTYRVAGQFEEQ